MCTRGFYRPGTRRNKRGTSRAATIPDGLASHRPERRRALDYRFRNVGQSAIREMKTKTRPLRRSLAKGRPVIARRGQRRGKEKRKAGNPALRSHKGHPRKAMHQAVGRLGLTVASALEELPQKMSGGHGMDNERKTTKLTFRVPSDMTASTLIAKYIIIYRLVSQ